MVIAKTKKSGDISQFEKAVFNVKQFERARREYKFLENVHKVFENKNNLNVPIPIIFLEDLNTLIFTKAKGADLGKFINQFEYSLVLRKRNQLKLMRMLSNF